MLKIFLESFEMGRILILMINLNLVPISMISQKLVAADMILRKFQHGIKNNLGEKYNDIFSTRFSCKSKLTLNTVSYSLLVHDLL